MHLPFNSSNNRIETLGADTANSTGTSITAGATNAKGSWTNIGTASFAYEGLLINLAENVGGSDFLLDVGIDDGAANMHIIIPDLHLPVRKTAGEQNFSMYIPVHVPAGAIIDECAVRATSRLKPGAPPKPEACPTKPTPEVLVAKLL